MDQWPTGLSEVETRALAAVDDGALVAYLCELVGVPSLTGEESVAQRHIAAEMGRAGLEVDVWEVDLAELGRHPSFCAEVARAEGIGVVGSLGRPRGGRDLILNGHIDVVPAGDESNWRFPPWRGTVHEGRVYGRGSVDMKGGLCAALFAARAIREAGVQLRGRLLVQSVVGEEDGGTGTLAAVLRGYRADGAVVIEPTGLAVIPAHSGAANFRITVPGLSAHGAMREEGVSAIEKFIPIYQALTELEAERNARDRDPLFHRHRLPHPLSVGTIHGGNWPSTVPESVVLEGRYGIAVGEEMDSARRELEASIARVSERDPWLRDHPPRVEWWGGQFAPASTPLGDPIVTAVSRAVEEVTGAPARLEGMTAGTDLRLLVNEGGTPAVLFGPGDVALAHAPDEFVPIDQLVAVTRALVLTTLRFCGHDG